MWSKRKILGLGFAIFLALAGCGKDNNSNPAFIENVTAEPIIFHGEKFGQNVPLGTFKITFDGRTESENSTTFTWILHSPTALPALRNFFIQLPECSPDPLSFHPDNYTLGYSPSTPGIYGVQWNLQVETHHQNPRQYSITLPGNVPLGEVYTVLTEGPESDTAVVPGPCQGYEISGRVYVDADGDGQWNSQNESGIANVLVELIDSRGLVQAMATDQNGEYIFRRLNGNFTIILPLDQDPGHFNSQLAESFVATSPLSRTVIVPPHSPQNNFGFDTLHENIVTDLYTGELFTTGKPLEYWQEEVRVALLDDELHTLYNGKTLVEILDDIQGLFLNDPYGFTPGLELIEAYEILSSNPTEMYDRLLAELLTTELNHFAEIGLLNQEELQLVLIAWGESLLAFEIPGESGIILQNEDQIIEANRLFKLINTGGGGGVDE